MSRRIQRAEKEIQQIAAEFLVKNFSLNHGAMVTVTRVQLSPDLRQGRVYVTVFSIGEDSEASGVIDELQTMAASIQAQVARSVRMKFNPKLTFVYDHGQEQTLKVEGIIRGLSGKEKQSDDV